MTFYIGTAGIPLSTQSESTENGIRRVAELGLNLMEVEFVQGVRMTDETGRKIGKIAEEVGVRLSCHGPYFINLNAKESIKIARSRKHILDTARVADAMGAYVFAFHAGFYLGMDKEKVNTTIRSELRECLSIAEKNGWKPLFGLETTGKHTSWGTLDEIIELSKEFKQVVPVIDFAHIHARTNGGLKSEKDFETILKKYDSLRRKSLHTHFSGIKYSEKGELSHLTFKETHEPDFRLLAPALIRREYDISLVCESPALEVDALFMKKTLDL